MKKLILGPPVLLGCWLCWLLTAIFVALAIFVSIVFSIVDGWLHQQRGKLFTEKPVESQWMQQSDYEPKSNRLARWSPGLARFINGLKHLCYLINNQTLQNRKNFRPIPKP